MCMYTGINSAYVGGYTSGLGEATIDGVNGAAPGNTGGGNRLSQSNANSTAVNDVINDTWEYLTIKNYTSSLNNSVMGNIDGGATDLGDTYLYDTIGPNLYGPGGAGAPTDGQNSGGGYGIDGGSNTTVENDCLTNNAQGGLQQQPPLQSARREQRNIGNGIGSYPDTGRHRGQARTACGCSGGMKVFFSLNATVTGNYVHDNYNAGIWFDFDNSGAEHFQQLHCLKLGLRYRCTRPATTRTSPTIRWSAMGGRRTGRGQQVTAVPCASATCPALTGSGRSPAQAAEMPTAISTCLTPAPTPI